MKTRRGASLAVREIALVGMMAAILTGGKLALAVLPNVEVVTLLCALYGYVFGWLGIPAILVFVSVEPLMWGFNTWVLTYYLYWPFVGIVFMFLSHLGVKKRFPLTACAVLLVIWFGVLSSLVDVGLFTGFYENFFYRFGIYYARGIVFYLVEIACNAVVFPLLFLPLSRVLYDIKGRILPEKRRTSAPIARAASAQRETLPTLPDTASPDHSSHDGEAQMPAPDEKG